MRRSQPWRASVRRQAWGDGIERAEDVAVARRAFQRVAKATGAERSDGLVIASYLSVRRAGRIVRLSIPGANTDPPRRRECDGISPSAQRRLLILLHSLRRDAALPVMVTLTFPEEVVVTPHEAKQCRRAWEKRMVRIYGPRWCAIWRMEAHPVMSLRLGRVHPHLHLLTWGAWYDLEQVSATWTDVVWAVLGLRSDLTDDLGRSVSKKHLAAGTNCEIVRKWEGVIYCAKRYLAKPEEYPIGKAGRVWGYCQRQALPIAEEEVIPLTAEQTYQVRVGVERWMRAQEIVSEHIITTFFADDPSAFVSMLMENVSETKTTPMPKRPQKYDKSTNDRALDSDSLPRIISGTTRENGPANIRPDRLRDRVSGRTRSSPAVSGSNENG